MNAVKQDVEKLVQKELKSANQKFQMFRSDHEGAAVILEEIEESRQEMNEVELQFRGMWNKVKADYRSSIVQSRHIYIHSLNLACEAIQVAAMAQKFIDSQKEREKNEDN